MHPLVTIATAAAGLYAGVRIARQLRSELGKKSAGNRFHNAAGKKGRDRSGPRDMGELKLDAHAGVYRPNRS